jgi:hypothetical protein
VRSVETPKIPVEEAASEVVVTPIRDDQRAFRAEDAEHVREGNQGFADVVKHVAGYHQVKSLVFIREAFRLAMLQFDAWRKPLPRDGEHFRGRIDSRQARSRVRGGELVE